MIYDGTNIQEVLDAHQHWLNEEEDYLDDGQADFSGADLRNMHFCGSNLYGANFSGADLEGTIFAHCDLKKADFTDAKTGKTDFYCADVRGARGLYIPLACPSEGSFVAWKRGSQEDGSPVIIKLRIPEDAERLSTTERACWASKAEVLEIQTIDGDKLDLDHAYSMRDDTFRYTVGETAIASGFNDDRFGLHGKGIYFFLDRQEAVYYWDLREIKTILKERLGTDGM